MSKRKQFSLLEVMISISIASILFCVLFSKIREFVVLRKEISSAETECLERQFFQIRLQELLTSLTPSQKSEGKYRAPIFYKNGRLYFQTERSLDIDPVFTGNLSYSFWQDPHRGHLLLACETDGGNKREEILAKAVSDWKVQFFSSKDNAWSDSWSQEAENVPEFLKISYKKQSNHLEYLFVL